jgi:hypothetical protein
MPKNCSADVAAVMAYIDQVFMSSNQSAIQAIKDSFGMGDMTHLDDVAGACGYADTSSYPLTDVWIHLSSAEQSLGLAVTTGYFWPRNSILQIL